MATIGSLIIRIGTDLSDLESGLQKSQTLVEKAAGGMGKVLKIGLAAAAVVATTAVIGLGAELTSCVGEAMEAQEGQAQLAAVLKSTGGVAGVTAEMANDLAESLQGVTRFSDDAILSGENLLLTFTNIGQDIFPDTTKVMLDMSQALGTDLKSSAIMLGKALQDPIEGVGALRRVGVNFNDAQEAMIKSMVNSGNLMGAQKLILAELQREFGGAAVAAGNTFAGKLDILGNKIGNIKEKIGMALLPALTQLADTLIKVLDSPEVQAAVTGFSNIITQMTDWVVPKLEGLYLVISGLGNLLFASAINWDPLLKGLAKLFGDDLAYPIMLTLSQITLFIREFLSGNTTNAQYYLRYFGESLQTLLAQVWPGISAQLQTWATGFWNWLAGPGGVLETTGTTVGTVITAISDCLTANWPTISARLTEWAGRFWDWIELQVLPTAGEKLNAVTTTIQEWANAPETQKRLNKLGDMVGGGLVDGMVLMIENTNRLNGVGWKLVGKLFEVSTSLSESFHNIGASIASGIVEGIIKKITGSEVSGDLKRAIKSVMLSVLSPIPGLNLAAVGLPGFQYGGVVPGPTGAPRLVMAHGGETISPADQRQYHYYLNVESAMPSAGLARDFNMLKAMAQ